LIANFSCARAEEELKENVPETDPATDSSPKTENLFDLSLDKLSDVPVIHAPSESQDVLQGSRKVDVSPG